MYLTRAFLDPTSREVQADLRNPEGLHKTVMRAFPDDGSSSPRSSQAVLFRLDSERDDRVVLLIQSVTEPKLEHWPASYVLDFGTDLDLAFSNVGDNPAVRNVEAEHAAIRVGARYAFRLRANTTRKIDTKSAPDGTRRHGRRVPVRGEDGRREWLARHAAKAGFSFDDGTLVITEVPASGGVGGKKITVAGAVFEGILQVLDVETFRSALVTGIGPAKAYGFGLLSVRRVP
jgi:CRISPR system Cascade subunit CasE